MPSREGGHYSTQILVCLVDISTSAGEGRNTGNRENACQELTPSVNDSFFERKIDEGHDASVSVIRVTVIYFFVTGIED